MNFFLPPSELRTLCTAPQWSIFIFLPDRRIPKFRKNILLLSSE